MRAALLVAPGAVVVDEIPADEVGPDDVEIQVGGVGLCGSDASVFSGKWPTPSTPWVMGHEAFGTVTAVGERVPQERIGETVVVEPNIVCLACGPCRRGLTSACESRVSVGMNRRGALAERLVVPSRFAWSAESIDPRALVCVEPLAVVETALRRLSGALPAAAMVIGAGPQGLLMCLALMMRGVTVHILDPNEERLAFAGEIGAEIEPGTAEFDLVVDSVGSPAAHDSAIARAAPGASIVVLGLDERPLGLSARTIVRRQLQIRGSLTYDHPADFRHTLELLRSRKIDPGRLVLHEFPLSNVQQAFEQAPHLAGKTWVNVGGPGSF